MAKAKGKTSGFSMSEYMLANAIPGSPRNPVVTQMVAQHLARMGMVRVRKGNGHVWVTAEEAAARKTDYRQIHKRLKEIGDGKAD